MSEIMTVCFQDICEITSSKRIFYEEYVNHGIPFYRSKEIIELANNKPTSTELYISENRFNEIAQKFGYPQANDILLTSVGTLGQVYLVDGTHKFYFKDGNLTWFRKWKENVYPMYICHWLKSKIGQQSLLDISIGSTQQALTITGLKSIEVPLPRLPEQQAIAEVLSRLDDKIDLLHRNNKTLEEMAETLFRQWFVDLEFNSTINDVSDVLNGYAFKSSEFNSEGANHVIKIKNIGGSSVNISDCDRISEYTANKTNNKFKVCAGDILFAMTGAEIGKMGIVGQTDKSLWLNQRVGNIKDKVEGSKYLAYLALKSDLGQDFILNTASGSAQPNISATDISRCPFPCISKEQIIEKSTVLKNLFDKVIHNLGQISVLTSTRDTLIPKLMSGQVRVNINA